MTNSSTPKTPVTVIGGFLGAGKTTFLNHLLRTSTARCAVLVNDFGAVNIDASLISKHDGTTLTLTNGCVCCSIGGGFIETLGGLLDSGTAFDHIVIEASGVGDPWKIAEIALIEPSLRLNAVIVLADASRIAQLLQDPRVGDTVRNQFEHCDLVLLSKTDLIDQTATNAARYAITSLRDRLRIAETSQHMIPELVLIEREPTSDFRAEAVSEIADHERLFKRWSYQRPGKFERTRLADAMQALPPQLLRLKGMCQLIDETGLFILQMVERRWSLTSPTNDARGEAGILLVGVGTIDLPEVAELEVILDRALATADDTAKIKSFFPNDGDITRRASSAMS